VLIDAFPGIEVLLYKRADVFRRGLDCRSLHIDTVAYANATGGTDRTARGSTLREVSLALSPKCFQTVLLLARLRSSTPSREVDVAVTSARPHDHNRSLSPTLKGRSATRSSIAPL
jgi:hypothetical protein